MLSGDLHVRRRSRWREGEEGPARGGVRDLPADPADARVDGREGRRRPSTASSSRPWSGSSTGSASRCTAVATRRGSTPATSTRSPTRSPGIAAARQRLPVRASGARRRGAVDGRGRPGRVPGHGLADRPRGAARGRRHLPLRPAPRRRRGPPRRAAPGAGGAARGGRARAQVRALLTSDPAEGERVLAQALGRATRAWSSRTRPRRTSPGAAARPGAR